MTSELNTNTVYNATTTSIITSSLNWRRRFILVCGFLMLFIGIVISVVFSYTYYAHTPTDDTKSKNPDETKADSDDGSSLVVFIFGLILIAGGLITLGVYFLVNRRSFSRGLMIIPKPKQSRGVLTVEQEKHTNNATSNEEKAELMRNELKNERIKNDAYEKPEPSPAYQNHYKPRNFNQHGYGQQRPAAMASTSNTTTTGTIAPLASLEEFDYSLRSSMNSLWSQHLHHQMNDYNDSDEDGYSFQSVVLP